MRKLFVFFLTFATILGVLVLANRPPDVDIKYTAPPPKPPVKPFDIEDALGVIDQHELKAMLLWFCSNKLEGRMSGKKGNELAKDFLVKVFKEFGYETSTQEFDIENLNNFKEVGIGKTSNVIGMLPGNDVKLKNETIVIGAHYDHIGYGPSMSRTKDRREIHRGADDNASGTVALIGAAKALSKMKGKNNRRIVVIAFSAEEMGLLGAKYYVDNPKYLNTVFMLNMDMVGRLRDKKVDARGAASSPDVKKIIENLAGYPFTPVISGGAGGGSDQVPFYQKSIPICFLHTGMHNDYHTPEDTVDKIDMVGLTWISKYAAHIVWKVDGLAKKPSFRGEVGEERAFSDH